eukprot:1424174-Alexandrium_andersonii.AAC.1
MALTAQADGETSEQHAERHAAVVQATIGFFQDGGSRVSVEKCRTMATSAKLRSRLKRWKYAGAEAPIP